MLTKSWFSVWADPYLLIVKSTVMPILFIKLVSGKSKFKLKPKWATLLVVKMTFAVSLLSNDFDGVW